MLTEEDRKEPLEHGCRYMTFKSCVDLSQGIEVIPYGSPKITRQQYSEDLMSFMAFWMNNVWEDLNGFQGFSHVKIDFSNCEFVD